MLPRIDAGERMARITDGAVAAGSMERGDTEKIMRGLTDAESGERRKAAKASPGALAGMGISVSGPSAPSETSLSAAPTQSNPGAADG